MTAYDVELDVELKEKILKLLKEKILKLLKEDEEFRYTIAGLIGYDEILKRLDGNERELIRLREDMMKMFQKHDERITSVERELIRLREDMMKGFELMERHLDALERRLDALGARWGLMTEGAFREGLRGLIEETFGARVEKWEVSDNEGFVYGHPSRVDVDIVIRDSEVILVEVTSHARRSDVTLFKRKAVLYEKLTGRKPSKLVIVTPYVDGDALELAKSLQIEVYTNVKKSRSSTLRLHAPNSSGVNEFTI